MLKLVNISKVYQVGNNYINALNGVSIQFNKKEFVAILGPSGCGKTTMLNIIGGLDRYSGGNLIINGRDTCEFNDRDWDSYRNKCIGFVFQNYHLIPHLSVLENVELSLTLSGVSAKERKEKALHALTEVGILDQAHKKPNLLSGGQRQRVAIARALINDPDIIMADEPTGALDSKTSIQIMNLLKKISSERLVIMVTHNQQLAHEYASRIIQMQDGLVISDSLPTLESVEDNTYQAKKTSMKMTTALRLSFKNLLTKMRRTFITSFAGSIGIIGVAIVLSLTSGFSREIDILEKGTLSQLPLTIRDTDYDYSALLSMTGDDLETAGEGIYPAITPSSFGITNLIEEDFVEMLENMDSSYTSEISYDYAGTKKLITSIKDQYRVLSGSSLNFNINLSDQDLLSSQYEVVYQDDDLVENTPLEDRLYFVIDSYNRVSGTVLTSLGYDITTIDYVPYEDIVGQTFSLITNAVFYTENSNNPGFYSGLSSSSNQTTLEDAYNHDSSRKLTIVGVYKELPELQTSVLTTGIVYHQDVATRYHESCFSSTIAQAQIDNKVKNVLSTVDFNNEVEYYNAVKALGGIETPVTIKIFAKNYASREKIIELINEFNDQQTDPSKKIKYNDLAKLATSTFSTIIGAISVVLTAFASISLVVSSVMIGIITFASVLERTKEIGILRSIGARKKDISRVFNAETIIIGFAAGVIGVTINALLCIPINAVFNGMDLGMYNIANPDPIHAIILIIVSMSLTFIAGLIPARIAARKDPVVALRTE